MIDFREFIRRSMDGPVMLAQEFDLRLSRALRRIAVDHGIHFKPAEIICDDATADAIFHAAVELIGQVGIYNVDTSRVILLTAEEVLVACAETPGQVTLGAGKDAVTVAARSHDSLVVPYGFRWPLTHCWIQGKEPFLSATIEAHLSEPGELGDLARELKPWLKDVQNKAGTVGDTMWAVAIARWCLAVARLVGRTDMFVGPVSAITVPAILACFAAENVYKKHHSSFSVATMPELKTNWEHLQLAFIARQMGLPSRTSGGNVLGAYARNAEETAVLSVATLLVQLSYAAARWAHLAPSDLHGYRTSRVTMQTQSAATRAAERNVGIATSMQQLVKNGLGSAFGLYEIAALVIEQTCSGVSSFWNYPCHPGPGGSMKSDLDYDLVMKVARGVAGMEREKANGLLNKVLGLYEASLEHPEKGKPYSFYYDLRTLSPAPELVELHRRVEDQLAGLGVPMR
ncbi:MAG: monomethylamine:corrinoid methyltransferase [Chloroflexi bacterium]|nr:monomethylamine:corrinoid methyltransferase [Chloroflexota bacterium]